MIKCNVTVCGVIGRDASIRTNKEGKTFLVFPLRVMIPDTCLLYTSPSPRD